MSANFSALMRWLPPIKTQWASNGAEHMLSVGPTCPTEYAEGSMLEQQPA
ncbi:MAG TPA: hypothetical protein VJX73_04825 [Terracidiphilus sp.]|nr:hypothetical protein [Terracidiphilus sp.]